MLAQKKIFDAIANGSGFFQHGHTYLGHPLACAAALAVQEVDRARRSACQRARAQGAQLRAACSERFGNHPHVGDIRGRGLFRRRARRRPRAPRRRSIPRASCNARIKREAMARGLMVYPMGGTVDGVRGDHVLLAPPFIVDAKQIDAIVERLGDAVDAATRQVCGAVAHAASGPDQVQERRTA